MSPSTVTTPRALPHRPITGKPRTNRPPEEDAKAKLRRQALGWLKAEHDARAKLLETGPAQKRPAIAETLNHWRQDNGLAGIRAAKTLAELPGAEPEVWFHQNSHPRAAGNSVGW